MTAVPGKVEQAALSLGLRQRHAGTSIVPVRIWEIYLAVSIAGSIGAMFLIERDEPTAQLIGAGALLLGIAALYLLLGRRAVDDQATGWQAYALQGGVLPLFGAAVWLVSSASLMVFAIPAMAYLTLPTAVGHAAVVIGGLVPPGVELARAGEGGAAVVWQLPRGLGMIVLAIFLAELLDYIARRNAERLALIEQLEASRTEVARLSRAAGAAEERQRIGSDLHDTVAQGLSSVVLLVEAAQAAMAADPALARRHLDLAARTARENLHEARALVGVLTPGPRADISLADAAGRLVARFAAETSAGARLVVEGTSRHLPTGIEVVLLRVIQEALANARKHASATELGVRLAFAPDAIAVEVRDNGAGFDASMETTGYGLSTMRNRVEQIGGRFSIRSRPGAGTTVRAEAGAR